MLSHRLDRPLVLFADSMTCMMHRPNSSSTMRSCTTSGWRNRSASSACATRHEHAASTTSVVTNVYGSLQHNLSRHKRVGQSTTQPQSSQTCRAVYNTTSVVTNVYGNLQVNASILDSVFNDVLITHYL